MTRSRSLDAVRGGLVALMSVYHAFYIAALFGLSGVDVYRGWWWLFPRGIAAGFVFVSGWSIAIKRERGGRFRDFVRRFVLLAVPAACVSAVSAIMFGDSWVFFGILHLLALSSLLVLPFLGRPIFGMAAGAAIMAAGLILGQHRWEWPWLAWLGFRPANLYPADYLPLMPWFAWCLFGSSARSLAARLTGKRPGAAVSRETQSAIGGPAGKALDTLAFLGRHSLVFYLAHLPALYGIFWLVSRLVATT